MTTIDGFPVAVEVGGPERATDTSAVVLLAAAGLPPAAYDTLCRRLHTAALRTVVIGADDRLTAKAAVALLDELGVKWSVVVGDRAGGALAWELAATRADRFTGLVAVDAGHPRVPDLHGTVRDAHCPPVEIDTTVLTGSAAAHSLARASGRWVYGDYRVVELPRRRTGPQLTAQLAAEIVLRTSTW